MYFFEFWIWNGKVQSSFSLFGGRAEFVLLQSLVTAGQLFIPFYLDSVTPTVELNALCMKLGKKPMYKPIDPYTGMRSTYNYTMRGGTYPPRYVLYDFGVLQAIVLTSALFLWCHLRTTEKCKSGKKILINTLHVKLQFVLTVGFWGKGNVKELNQMKCFEGHLDIFGFMKGIPCISCLSFLCRNN